MIILPCWLKQLVYKRFEGGVLMNYNILASGSLGNCTIINDFIAIDMGIPFAKIKPYYKKLKVVFITHQHSDHINKSTVKELRST